MGSKVIILVLTTVMLSGGVFFLYTLSSQPLPNPFDPGNPVTPISGLPTPVQTPTPIITTGPEQPILTPTQTPSTPNQRPTYTRPTYVPTQPPVYTSPTPVATTIDNPYAGEANASINLSPFYYQASPFEPVTFEVRVDTIDQEVVAVSAHISYDSDYFSIEDIDVSQSAFAIEADTVLDSANGEIRIDRGSIQPLSGDLLIGYIHAVPMRRGLTEFKVMWQGENKGPSRIILNDGKGTDILGNTLSATIDIP